MMIPDWKMEKYLTGDLPPREMENLKKQERENPEFAARVQILKKDGEAFLKAHPFENLNHNIQKDSERWESFFGKIWNVNWFRPALGAFAALAFVFLGAFAWLWNSSSLDISTPLELAMAENVRVKGLDMQLEVWKKTSGKAVKLENLESVQEGDEVQMRYFVPKKCFGILFSMDGNGVLTIHLGNGNRAVELDAGKMRVLPFAYRLDDAPYFEKFFLAASEKEFAIDEKKLDESLNRNDIRTVSVTLRKEGKE